jgi:hypothetical protein
MCSLLHRERCYISIRKGPIAGNNREMERENLNLTILVTK